MRPEFFTDPIISKMHPAIRLTYIGLWCVADDAGWLIWDEAHIAAMLYPYESVRVRESRLRQSGEAFIATGRLVVHPCRCAQIPRLEDHQKIGGNKSFTVKDRHAVHTGLDKSPGKVGSNGRYVNAQAHDEDETAAMLDAWRRQGLPVDSVQ